MKKLDNYDSSNHYTALPISYENLNHSCPLTTENFYSENAFYGACNLWFAGRRVTRCDYNPRGGVRSGTLNKHLKMRTCCQRKFFSFSKNVNR